MKYSAVTSPTFRTSGYSVLSVSFLSKVSIFLNLSKDLEGIFVGYGVESHTYRVYNKLSGIIVESCSVEFDENDGSHMGQVDVCDADVEIPQDAIRRMGVGFFRPIEEPLVADREGQCSTLVDPSSTQDQQAPTAG